MIGMAGGRLSIKCPGSTREVRLLQQLLYAEERNEWVKVSLTNVFLQAKQVFMLHFVGALQLWDYVP